MWRASSRWTITLWLCAGATAPPPAARAQEAPVEGALLLPSRAVSEAERVADYLERTGLRGLLIEHLERQLEGADATEKPRIVERLSPLYARLLERAPDEAERRRLLERAERLIAQAPKGRAYDLRLQLLRERYRVGERLAEDARLELASAEQRADALAVLASAQRQLKDLATELGRRESELRSVLERAQATSPEKIEAEMAQVRQWGAGAEYFGAWSGYYRAMLLHGQAGSDADARALTAEALRAFARLTQVRVDNPVPPEERRENWAGESDARSAVGMALSLSLAGKAPEALQWLGALEAEPKTHAGVRASLLGWRIVVLARAQRWADIAAELAVARDERTSPGARLPEVEAAGGVAPGTRALPTPTARLLAVLALAPGQTTDEAARRELGRQAIADLITRRELAQVLDLVRRFGADAIADGGFVGSYVLAHKWMEEARQAHTEGGKPSEEPATTPELVNRFNDASRKFAEAMAQPDAKFFPRDGAVAAQMGARALFLAGKLRESAEQFSRAGDLARSAGDLTLAEECLWLCVGVLDRAAGATTSLSEKAAIDERLDQVSELFLKEFPSGDRAAQLALRQAARSERLDERTLTVLLGVTRGSPLYEASRRQASRMLYRAYRAAPAGERPFLGARFLRVADELLGADHRAAVDRASPGAGAAQVRAGALARQMLDVLLSGPAPDVERADAVLRLLMEVIGTDQARAQQVWGADWPTMAGELDLRRVQLLLARGRAQEASDLAGDLLARAEREPAGSTQAGAARRFAVAARVAVYQDAERRWKALTPEAPQEERLQGASRVLLEGQRALDLLASNLESYRDGSVAQVALRAAAAGAERWDLAQDAGARDAALRLDRAVLAQRPGVPECLERVARLSEAAGDLAASLEAWQALSVGLQPGEELWGRAKFNHLRVLARQDPAQARVAAQQHVVLYPRGAEPWHARIVQLLDELERSAPAPAPDAGGGA
jgi:hypothetical protein